MKTSADRPEPAVAQDPLDVTIVERVRGGDRASFELLMRRHNQRLYRAARAVLRDDAESEDVVQEAWVRVYEHLDRFRGEAAFSTWATRIALHEAFARARRRGTRVRWEECMSDETDSVAPLEPRDPERRAMNGQLAAVLRAEIDDLPVALRTVLVLRDVEGLSTAEVARCLEISPGATKVRLHRARAALRSRLRAHVGLELGELHAFAGHRCDRIVAAVLARIEA